MDSGKQGNLSVPFSSGQGMLPEDFRQMQDDYSFQSPFHRVKECYPRSQPMTSQHSTFQSLFIGSRNVTY